jgi:hypothetical protein
MIVLARTLLSAGRLDSHQPSLTYLTEIQYQSVYGTRAALERMLFGTLSSLRWLHGNNQFGPLVGTFCGGASLRRAGFAHQNFMASMNA